MRTYLAGDVAVEALRGIDLTVEAGEYVAVMGPSGCGKSSLMNILGCLDRPTSGSYELLGRNVSRLSRDELATLRNQTLGFVFQDFNLLPRTSAIENIELPLLYSAVAGSDQREGARRALARVGLGGRDASTPTQLSGGQQQRVAIARALVTEPKIILADEPTGNLDSQTSDEILSLLDEFHARGMTLVVVTHESYVAERASRVVVMRDGRIVEDRRQRRDAAIAAPAKNAPSALRRGGAAGRLWRATLELAFRSLRRNPLRSGLTSLGVVIGVAAVIAMVSLGQGARAALQEQIASVGTNMVMVFPGASTTAGARAGWGTADRLTVGEAKAIEKQVTGLRAVSYYVRNVAQVQAPGSNWTTMIWGVPPSYAEVRDWGVASGEFLSQSQNDTAAKVAVLGHTVATMLFGEGQDPVGEQVRIKGVPFRVIGVLEPKGQSAFGQDQDDVVLVPFTTAERKVLGTAKIGGVDMIQVSLEEAGDEPRVMDEITELMRQRRRTQPGEEEDFAVRTLDEMARAADSMAQIMSNLLLAIASISLLVGGIGIMNILLVSVTERTREIGIRMAVGAKGRHILWQFLCEAVALSALGGTAGIVLGIAAAHLISTLSSWPTLVSPLAVAGSFLFSGAVGVFFGFYPARTASRLNPIQALRHD